MTSMYIHISIYRRQSQIFNKINILNNLEIKIDQIFYLRILKRKQWNKPKEKRKSKSNTDINVLKGKKIVRNYVRAGSLEGKTKTVNC